MTESKAKKTKTIFLLIRIGVVLGGITWAIIWLSKGQKWTELKNIFLNINVTIFIAVLFIFIAGQVIVGLRWWLLLRTQHIFIDFFAAVRLHFLGLFYNNFMPSSVGGDLVRAWYVTKHTEKKFQAALSVFVDRIIGFTSTLVIAAFFFFALHEKKLTSILKNSSDKTTPIENSHLPWMIIIVSLLLLILVVVFLAKTKAAKKIIFKIQQKVMDLFNKLKDAVIIYCKSPITILTVFSLTVFMQIITITGFYFIGKSLGITTDVKYYYMIFTLTWVLGALPISVGGAVVVEGMLTYLFVQLASVQTEPALALALSQRIIWMLASLPGAVIHIAGFHLPKDFSVDYPKTID